jgi:hypothetical protein
MLFSKKAKDVLIKSHSGRSRKIKNPAASRRVLAEDSLFDCKPHAAENIPPVKVNQGFPSGALSLLGPESVFLFFKNLRRKD